MRSAELWRSWGVEPSAVMGHSVGEFAAAFCRFVFPGRRREADRRTRPSDAGIAGRRCDGSGLCRRDTGGGGCRAICLSSGDRRVKRSEQHRDLGRSGGCISAVVDRLRSAGISSQPLTVSHAFHSPLMDSMLDPLERAASRWRIRRYGST